MVGFISSPFEGIKIIGLRWSPRSHEIKEFLARNGIPYQWLDIEDDEEARRLLSFVNSRKSTVISNLSSIITNSNHNDRLFSTTNENAINNNNNIDRNILSHRLSHRFVHLYSPPLYIYQLSFFLMVHTYLNQPIRRLQIKLVLRLVRRWHFMIC
jgi:hypothetical protein